MNDDKKCNVENYITNVFIYYTIPVPPEIFDNADLKYMIDNHSFNLLKNLLI